MNKKQKNCFMDTGSPAYRIQFLGVNGIRQLATAKSPRVQVVLNIAR